MTRNNVIVRGYGHKKDSEELKKEKQVRAYNGFYLGVVEGEAFVGVMEDTVSILVDAYGDTYLQKLQIEPGMLTGTTYCSWQSLGMIEQSAHLKDSWQYQGKSILPNQFREVDVLSELSYVPRLQTSPPLSCVAWRASIIANTTPSAWNHCNEPVIWVTGKSNPDIAAWGFKLVNLILAGLGTKGNTAAITICGAFTATFGKSMASCYRESGYNPVKFYEQVILEVPTIRASFERVQTGILENPQLWLGLDRDLADDCLCFWLKANERTALRETVPLFTMEDSVVNLVDPTTTFLVGRRVVSTKGDSSCWGNLQHLGIVDSEFQQPVTKMLPPIKKSAVIVTA